MNDVSPVDRLYKEIKDAVQVLADANEPSLQTTVQDHGRKALLMAAASHFEHRITASIEDFTVESSGNKCLCEFIRNKAIARQYHTYFQWDAKNANSFFGLFGSDFKDHMKKRVAEDAELSASIRAFLELGEQRNRLVHQDYVSFALEKTSDEIYELYTTAMRFVSCLPTLLRAPNVEDSS